MAVRRTHTLAAESKSVKQGWGATLLWGVGVVRFPIATMHVAGRSRIELVYYAADTERRAMIVFGITEPERRARLPVTVDAPPKRSDDAIKDNRRPARTLASRSGVTPFVVTQSTSMRGAAHRQK